MMRFKQLLFFLLTLVMVACQSPDNLSNQNGVLHFEVTDISDADVVLGDVQLWNDSSLIRIPMLYGINSLPIVLKTELLIPDGARLLSINPEEVVFNSTQLEHTFYIVAANGATRRWKMELQLPADIGLSDLLDFDVTLVESQNALLLRQGQIDISDTTIRIVVPETDFPLTITPKIVLTDGSSLQNFVEGQTLRFENYEQEHTFRILTPDNALVEWRVVLQKPNLLESNQGVGWSVWQAVSFTNKQLSWLSQPLFNGVVDAENNGVWLLNNSLLSGTFAVQFNYTIPNYVSSIGLVSGQSINLTAGANPHTFYLYDSVRQTCKKWHIGLVSPSEYYGGFSSFKVVQNSPSSVEFINDSIIIDELGATIWLPYRGNASSFPIMIKVNFTPESGCVVSGLQNNQSVNFFVATQESLFNLVSACGVDRKWKIRLLPNSESNKLVGVSQVEIQQVYSQLGKLTMNSFAEIDESKKRIKLQVSDWSDDMPVTLSLALALMPGTIIENGGWNGIDALTFNSFTDNYLLNLSSADASSHQTYTIELENKARVRSSKAEVMNFAISQLSSGYVSNNVDIDASTNTITILLSSVGSGSLWFTPSWQLSSGAYVEGIVPGNRFLFGATTDMHQFVVVSEDESQQQVWTLKVNSSPQLNNWDLNIWNSSTVVDSWATPNSAFGNTVERDVHDDGYCAKLTTSSVLGNIAAGSLFLGSFQMDLAQLGNTKRMVYLGIPFTSRPTSMQVDVKYDSNGGDDQGSAEIELIHYEGTDYEYHNLGDEEGITIVARGKQLLTTTSGWETITIPLETLEPGMSVTHISVIFSSSYRGDDLIGTNGATLWVDNVRLNY